MSQKNCPLCGSKYIVKKDTTSGINDNVVNYYCQSCKQIFKDKHSVEGEWLFTVFDGELSYGSKKELKVFKDESGIQITQREYDDFKTRKMTPHVKVKQIQTRTCVKYVIWFDSFTHFNDGDGKFFSADIVKLNPELTKRALENEAMRIIHKNGNEFRFDRGGYDDTVLLSDIKAWFDEIISEAGGTTSGGCYVATSVYGSYNCPEVWTLRRYRDFCLAKTWYGRAFISVYYKISPTVVRVFGKTKAFQLFFRHHLDKMVQRLKANGYEDTRYEDHKY